MSYSLVDLEVIARAGQPQDKKNAEKILPMARKQHLLLCTLLIYKTIALEALPIFLDAILPSWGAILISVTLVLAFAEILPHAVSVRYGLSVGARLSVLVHVLVEVLLPLSYPICKVLDWLLGRAHTALLRRSELKALVDLHANEAGKGGELTNEETSIIIGALELTEKTAKDAMTPMSKVFSLDINAKFNKHMMELIMRKGHSRVPIYSGNPSNIIGIILVKSLIFCRPECETPIRNLTIRRFPRFHEHQPLYDILNQFQKGHSHMGVVVKGKHELHGTEVTEKAHATLCKMQPNTSIKHEQPRRTGRLGDENLLAAGQESLSNVNEEVIGIITMEDVMEQLLQGEILDETDILTNAHKIKLITSPVKSSSARSSSASVARTSWSSTAMASPVSAYHTAPFSSYYHTSLLQSPVPPYLPSPLIRPCLLSSPGRSILGSPATHAGPLQSSPSSQSRVTRKSYETLQRPGEP
ncbi:hypothetical protein Ancab_009177 [Ancistrocladus abbreviatus]